jgi:shikimate dehydrogenase
MNEQFIMAGVMGWPVAHSRSPLIHNHWIKKYQLSGAYGRFPVEPKNLEAAIRGLSALGLAGCNITIPHKVEAMQYMDWVDPHAQKIGAINTVVVQANGTRHGYNNDGFGYLQSLKEAHAQWRADAGPVVVLGAGGAARAILVALLQEGATEIRLLNRTLDKAQALAQEFGPSIQALPWSQRHEALAQAALLINTTNQGMHGTPALDLALDELPTTAMVSDIIYTPLVTPLLEQARQRGNTTVNGLGMLIHQARPAFEAWFGIKPAATSEISDLLIASL